MIEITNKLLITAVICVAVIVSETHGVDKSDSLYFVANNKGLDYKISGKKDAHRFGVELKENKQFHHTITAEDGVRLGCYGYELNGMKYSTNYIADGKGYRLAPSTDLITVFAKGSSEPRIASFKESFTAEEIEKANIKYFFPEGCEAPKIFYDPNNPSRAFDERRKLFDALVQKAQAEKLKSVTNDRDEAAAARNRNGGNGNSLSNNNSDRNNSNNGSPHSSTNSSTSSNLTKNPRGGSDDNLSLNPQNKFGNPGSDFNRRGKSTLFSDGHGGCCDTGVQIVLPQSTGGDAECPGRAAAKIIIPLDATKLSCVPMHEFMDISAQATSTASMLAELQKLVIKYDL